MNILVINHYAGSPRHGMEYRHYYLSKEWVRLGHNVTLVGASFSHLHSTRPHTTGSISEEDLEGIRYLWLKTPSYAGNGIRRVVNMLKFGLTLLRHSEHIIRTCRPDLVIASSPHPFVIFGARRIASRSRAKLSFEVRDLWPLTLIELGGMSPLHPLVRVMQWTENYAYRVADRVVSLLPKADEYMVDHGMAPENFVYLPNGIDAEEWSDNQQEIPELHRATLKALKEKQYFIVGYAGALGIANALHTLVNTAHLMKKYPVAYVLVGSGPQKEVLQRQADELGLDKVVFLPPVDRVAIPTLLSEMDALFIGWNRKPLYRFGVSPNKLMDYMMAAKPVIHAIEARNDIVVESGCGISIPPEDPESLARAITELMQMRAEDRQKMGLKGKEFVQANHDYRVLSKRFIELVNGI